MLIELMTELSLTLNDDKLRIDQLIDHYSTEFVREMPELFFNLKFPLHRCDPDYDSSFTWP